MAPSEYRYGDVFHTATPKVGGRSIADLGDNIELNQDMLFNSNSAKRVRRGPMSAI